MTSEDFADSLADRIQLDQCTRELDQLRAEVRRLESDLRETQRKLGRHRLHCIKLRDAALRGERPPACYSDPVPTYGQLYPVVDFIRLCEEGLFTDYDGHGHPVQEGLMDSTYFIKPEYRERIPNDATHVMWFNK